MNTEYTYLDELNPQQRAAVEYIAGPELVIAGAGSGKTRVLTYKIVHLLRMGLQPNRILALTFTNKAAREMKERITAIVGSNISTRLWMGTFHSVFLRILRNHANLIGFDSKFTIYDTNDSRSLIKMIIKELGIDEKQYKPATVASLISNAKNAMITSDLYIRDSENYNRDKKAKRPLLGEIFRRYEQRCKLANAMDFDDILVYMNILMRDYKEVAERYQDYFQYLLVDEYQDTNFAQHLIISQLSAKNKRICVVGDDAQSIYSFRGADINHILRLEKRYPGLKIFKLERNYRSTKNIINAAGSLIEKNTHQMKKNVFSENDKGEPVNVVRSYSDMEEAFMIANLLTQKKFSSHDAYDEFAILYRTNAQSRLLEEALRKRNIPYRIYGGVSFYQRKEIKDMLAYFRLTVNPNDDEALKRIINYPSRGIGETTIKKLYGFASANSISIWNALVNFNLKEVGFNNGTVGKLNNFRNLIQGFINDNLNGANAYELGQLIFNRTGILTTLSSDRTPEGISRKENLSEVLAGLKEFVDIREQTGEGENNMTAFLSEIMLATDQDENDSDSQPKVTLMTVHAAKGLEYKHVYITGVEEDLFPSSMSQESLAQVEEERRLLYVAITRAKTTCTLSYAGSRFRNGQTVMTNPSRFLSDIDSRFLNLSFVNNFPTSDYSLSNSNFINPLDKYHNEKGKKQYRVITNQYGTSQQPENIQSSIGSGIKPQHEINELKVGTKIRHERFGDGKITKIGQLSGEDMIYVDFGVIGEKKLLLKFAKFEII